MPKKVAMFLGVLIFLCVTKGTPTLAAEKIVIGYPTTSSQFAPLWLAKDAGFYKKHGLDAELVFVRGYNLIQGMMAAQVDVAQTAVADAVVAILRGADIRFLGLTAKIFPYTLITTREIKTGKELKGGKIAINKLADVSEIATRLALKELGLTEKDVTMIQVGGSPQRLAALQSGNVQAAALDFMSGLRLAKEGYNVLIQISPSYPYLGLMASGKFIREKPAATEAFVKAFAEAVARFKGNKDEGVKVISHYMKSNDLEIVGKAYDFIATKFYAEDLQPDPKSFQILLEELSGREPLARKASIDQIFDLRIVNRLEQEGFFKWVFKK